MTLLEAIDQRRSSRVYLPEEITAEKVETLLTVMEECNAESGLHIQLVLNNGDAFNGFRKSYGLFSGVRNYIAVVGRTDMPHLLEKAGYYGERVVLEATRLGLGTCWVGGSYDRRSVACEIASGEKLVIVIAVGNVAEQLTGREKFIWRLMHYKNKTNVRFGQAEAGAPEWFWNGMEAVSKAPSAMNLQPVTFRYANGAVRAEVRKDSAYTDLDLGIAKLHFEIGSGQKIQW